MPKKTCPKKKSFDKAQDKKSKKNFRKEVLYLCSCCSLVFVLFLTSFNINSFLAGPRVLGATTENYQTKDLKEEEKYWEDFLSLHPTYLDGWLTLARVEYDLGNANYALGAYNTARAINPNSPKIKELENLLLK